MSHDSSKLAASVCVCVCEGVGRRAEGGWRGAGGIFPVYLYAKLFKIFSSETTGPIRYNGTEMFLRWPSIRIIQANLIRQQQKIKNK